MGFGQEYFSRRRSKNFTTLPRQRPLLRSASRLRLSNPSASSQNIVDQRLCFGFLILRRRRDSNPRTRKRVRFSKPVQLATMRRLQFQFLKSLATIFQFVFYPVRFSRTFLPLMHQSYLQMLDNVTISNHLLFWCILIGLCCVDLFFASNRE